MTAARRVVGLDVVEVAPLVEDHVRPVVVAKLAYELLGMAQIRGSQP